MHAILNRKVKNLQKMLETRMEIRHWKSLTGKLPLEEQKIRVFLFYNAVKIAHSKSCYISQV